MGRAHRFFFFFFFFIALLLVLLIGASAANNSLPASDWSFSTSGNDPTRELGTELAVTSNCGSNQQVSYCATRYSGQPAAQPAASGQPYTANRSKGFQFISEAIAMGTRPDQLGRAHRSCFITLLPLIVLLLIIITSSPPCAAENYSSPTSSRGFYIPVVVSGNITLEMAVTSNCGTNQQVSYCAARYSGQPAASPGASGQPYTPNNCQSHYQCRGGS
ncbi:hypothetical protein Cni_G24246 [Canna indica]|uniref:Rapid ALkalinization Factor n=1 Tax=Canna indica TaxID=4628 RepID=A0AAQ3QPD0_9LILI|nr:hypothetical protein Cni_G24246 [Canna indica]